MIQDFTDKKVPLFERKFVCHSNYIVDNLYFLNENHYKNRSLKREQMLVITSYDQTKSSQNC